VKPSPKQLAEPDGRRPASEPQATSLERPLAVRRRRDVVAVLQVFSGRRVWAVKDPVSLRYFHLSEEEFGVFESLDGASSLAEIQHAFERRFAPRRLSLTQLQSFLGLLHQEGLILADAPGQTDELLKRARSTRRRKLLEGLTNILAIRFRGVDPQRALDFLLSRCRWLFSWWAALPCVAVVLAAAIVFVTRFDAVAARLPDFDSFLNPSTILWLGVALALTKVLHELGHALTCRYFGAECHELGLLLLVFTPCLYCNVSDAWMIADKWRRAAIGAAGVAVELVLAAAAALLWWFSEPGLLNSLCLNVMIVSSASTLLFNGNPLMRYDGYFVLSDLVEIPNLAQAGAAVLREEAGAIFLGIPAHREGEYSARQRLFLSLYAISSTIYRTAVIVGILWFLHRMLKPYHLEPLTFLLAVLVALGTAGVPLWQAGRFIQHAYWSRQMQSRRAVTSGLVLTACLAALLLAPLPHRIAAPAVLDAENARKVYASVSGALREGSAIGAAVRAGEKVAVLENLDLKLEIARLRGQRDEQRLKLENLKRRQTRDDTAASQIPTAEEALADLEERLARRLEDEERLTVTAPESGTILPVRRKPRTYARGELDTWWGSPLDPWNRDCHVESGTALCQIGDAARLEATLVIDQSDVEFIRPGQPVEIQLDQAPGRVLSGTIQEIAEIDLKITPAELLPAGTIPTQPDEAGVPRPAGTVYQGRVALVTSDSPLLIGQTGQAKVFAGSLSLGRRLSRYLSRTFRFEM
jgi:putative peptide zinc metalloprotease protein